MTRALWRLIALCILAPVPALPAADLPEPPSRSEAAALIREGKLRQAAPVLRLLADRDVDDEAAAYWAARAAEMSGQESEARCRYLDLEGSFPGSRIVPLATRRRLEIERRQADALVALGPEGEGPGTAAELPVERLLLLPPENLTPAAGDPGFSLSWTYLLYDALRGSGVCPVPLPALLTVLDLLHSGSAVRASAEVAAHPVNTVEGLRGRLTALRAVDGSPYLERAAGAWTDDLEDALLHFQKDLGLPPTGEADAATQVRLERELESWLLSAPPSLDPKRVPRAAALLGATRVVRGTYRVEGTQITLLLTVLSADGLSTTREPISQSFPAQDMAAACAALSRRLVAELGGSPEGAGRRTEVRDGPLSPADFSAAVRPLLLQDRGMPQLALQHWDRAPSSWFTWPLAADVHRALSLSEGEAVRMEQALHLRWARIPELDPAAAMDDLLGGLGEPGLTPVAGPNEAGTFQVLGTEGILRIRAEDE